MKQNDTTKPASGDHSSAAASENGLARALQRSVPTTAEGPNNDLMQQNLPTAEEVEELASCGLAEGTIALLLGCSQSDLVGKFAHAIAHGRARQQQFLLEKLAERVEANEWPALRFALKNVLGMADNPEQAALQRHKLAQLREQDAAHTREPSPLSPPGAQPALVQSGPSESLPGSVSLPEQRKPPAPVRPRQRPGKQSEGGSACVPQK